MSTKEIECVFFESASPTDNKVDSRTDYDLPESYLNCDEITKQINLIKPNDMHESTCSVSGAHSVDKNTRDSSTANENVIVNLRFHSKYKNFIVYVNFEYICYDKGGHFDEHVDLPQSEKHNYTVLVYPPQEVEGGELVIGKYVVTPNKDSWKVVVFPLNVTHKSNPVISGTKQVLKGKGYFEESSRASVISSNSQVSDGAFQFYMEMVNKQKADQAAK